MSMNPPFGAEAQAGHPPPPGGVLIGTLLRDQLGWSKAEVEEILLVQRARGLRFGEAAVVLQMATDEDVDNALARQMQYPLAPAPARAALAPELVMAHAAQGAEAELFRSLRTQLLLGVLAPQQPRRALAVASCDAGAGKSFVAANLAAALSQLGGRTILIDADMRRPRQAGLMGIAADPGLSGVLAGRARGLFVHRVAGLPSLYVLPAGTPPPNAQELLQRPTFKMLIQECLTRFDHVVVDTPAATLGADFQVIGARTGATLVVARAGVTPYPDLERFCSVLRRGEGVIAGVVMNRVP